MDLATLKSTLFNGASTVSIAPRALTKTIDDFLSEFYGGLPITVRDAELVEEDPLTSRLVVRGTSSFFNVPGLNTVATFSIDTEGSAHVAIRYLVVDEVPAISHWKFSHSFADLPTVFDWSDYLNQTETSPLDKLDLRNATFVVCSKPVADYPFVGGETIALSRGINFVSHMRPSGPLGILRATLGASETLTLFGSVVIPGITTHVAALGDGEYPWDRDGVPGICLEARLHGSLGMDQLSSAAPAGQTSSLSLKDVCYRIYSPPSDDWLEANRTFAPKMAYTATLDVPSAGVTAAVTAESQLGATEVILSAEIDGLTLGSLGGLMDLTGATSLVDSLPSGFPSLPDQLKDLALLRVGLSVAVSEDDGLELSGAYASIGFKRLDWDIWPNRFKIESLVGHFGIEDPFGPSPKMSIVIEGVTDISGVPVRIRGTNRDGFTAQASLVHGETLPLKQLLSSYASTNLMPDSSDLTINALGMTVCPGKYYAFSAVLAQRPTPWTLNIGPAGLSVSDMVVNVYSPNLGRTTANFAGNITINNAASIAFRYASPDSLDIVGNLGDISLRDLVARLVNSPSTLGFFWPENFDVRLVNSSVLIQRTADNAVFCLATVVDGKYPVAFEVRRVSGEWGFAFGLDLGRFSPGNLDGLGVLKILENAFTLDAFTLLICTFEDTNFKFPSFSVFNSPDLPVSDMLPARPGIIAGLNVYARWDLDGSDQKQGLLKRLLNIGGKLDVVLQLGKDPSQDLRLYVTFDGDIAGQKILGKFGAQYVNGQLGLYLEGVFDLEIMGTRQLLKVTLKFLTQGALLSASMKSSSAIRFGEFFSLSNLAVVVGVNWAGEPSLGVAATLGIADIQSSLAVFFDSTDPKKSFVAGAISDLDLRKIVEAIASASVPNELGTVLGLVSLKGTEPFTIPLANVEALDNLNMPKVAEAFGTHNITIPTQSGKTLLNVSQPGKTWYLTRLTDEIRHYQIKKDDNSLVVSLQPQLYCVPERTELGDTVYEAGFFLNGRLKYFFLGVETQITVKPSKGISVYTAIDPIRIEFGGVTFFALTSSKNSSTGPLLSIATYSRPTLEDARFREPHFYIDGYLSMLGMEQQFYGKASSSGLEFNLESELALGVHAKLSGKINDSAGLDVSGSFSLGVKELDLGPLGKVTIDTGVSGSFMIVVNAARIAASLGGEFRFFGHGFDFSLGFDIRTGTILGMLESAWDAVLKALKDFFLDAARWAEAVAKGIVKGVEDVVAVLKDVYKMTEDAAKAVFDNAKSIATACAMETANALL
jgi:hypothetical protein